MSGPDGFSQSVSATLLVFHNLQPEMNAWLASRQEQIPNSSTRRFHYRAFGALYEKDDLLSGSGEQNHDICGRCAGRHAHKGT